MKNVELFGLNSNCSRAVRITRDVIRVGELVRLIGKVPHERRSEVKLRSHEFNDGGVNSDGVDSTEKLVGGVMEEEIGGFKTTSFS
ncbi:hypothetical protein Pint_02551 [Pistacia integerrima]|uniref:Uncharacterized protein n=1 Tax=Pistacia integerrima TaxID=434235 RepID=A0ACC0ZI58_9ROSI|nr:hypothetical protein Pint_02551 [Pistacia integerrima]